MHYTCIVVGDDYELALEPFDENMSVAPYKAYWDNKEFEHNRQILIDNQALPEGEHSLEDVVAAYNKRYHADDVNETKEIATGEEEHLPEGFSLDEQHPPDRVLIDDGGAYQWSTYNPKSKWDWYALGGRWRGYFRLKEDARATAVVGDAGLGENEPRHDSDLAEKRDIDIAWMRDDAGRRAGELWDRVQEAIVHTSEALGWEEHFMPRLIATEHGEDDLTIDQARYTYHAQPRVLAFKEWNASLPPDEQMAGWNGPDVEDFQITREEFVAQARDNAICPYAYIKDGRWYSPGKMGWFSSSETKQESREFAREFNEMLDALPDDTLLTLVDLHI